MASRWTPSSGQAHFPGLRGPARASGDVATCADALGVSELGRAQMAALCGLEARTLPRHTDVPKPGSSRTCSDTRGLSSRPPASWRPPSGSTPAVSLQQAHLAGEVHTYLNVDLFVVFLSPHAVSSRHCRPITQQSALSALRRPRGGFVTLSRGCVGLERLSPRCIYGVDVAVVYLQCGICHLFYYRLSHMFSQRFLGTVSQYLAR